MDMGKHTTFWMDIVRDNTSIYEIMSLIFNQRQHGTSVLFKYDDAQLGCICPQWSNIPSHGLPATLFAWWCGWLWLDTFFISHVCITYEIYYTRNWVIFRTYGRFTLQVCEGIYLWSLSSLIGVLVLISKQDRYVGISLICYMLFNLISVLLFSPQTRSNNFQGFTPLYYACNNGHLDLVQYLVEAGADVNLQNKQFVSYGTTVKKGSITPPK